MKVFYELLMVIKKRIVYNIKQIKMSVEKTQIFASTRLSEMKPDASVIRQRNVKLRMLYNQHFSAQMSNYKMKTLLSAFSIIVV